MSDSVISIEIVYGTPTQQKLSSFTVPSGSTIQEAIESSGFLSEFPEIDLNVNNVGIWNRSKKLSEVLKDGDRIEIYRPLIADPKEVRKRRAAKAAEAKAKAKEKEGS